MFCMKCGKKLEKDARFCAECGTSVASETPVPSVTPVAPVAPATETKSRPRKKIKTFSATVWSFVLVLTLLTAGIVGALMVGLSDQAIEAVLDRIELTEVTLKDTDGDEITLGEYLYLSVDEADVERYELTAEQFDTTLIAMEWKDDVKDIISECIDYFLYGETFTLEAKDLVDIVENNEDVIAQMNNGFCFDYDELEKFVEKGLWKSISPMEVSKTIGYDIGYFTSTVINVGSVLFWIVIAVCALALLFATRFSLLTAAQFAGVFSAIIGGSAYVGLSFCASNMTNWLAIPVLATVLAGPLTEAMTVCITVMTIGASLLVGATVFKKLTKKA